MHKDKFSSVLVNWYEANKRDLPWRETEDPYKIWLSEIILQQTRVQQGLPYYLKFIEAFPRVEDLAGAEESEVLRLWQGLGYYSRARNMHHAAQQIVSANYGKFPTTYKDLLKLKGIGKYTAAAIASFAFKEPVAVVDGNVYRVLSRIFGITSDISDTAGQKYFLDLANELIDKHQPDKHNQAIMEFGAIHCKPANPDCLFCPFSHACHAKLYGLQTKLPVKSKKVKVKERFLNYLVVESQGYLLMKERGKNDVWQGLFDFPVVETDNYADIEVLLEKSPDFAKIGSLITWDTGKVERHKHLLTHQKLQVSFFRASLPDWQEKQKLERYFGALWYPINEITLLPKPILIDKYLKNNF